MQCPKCNSPMKEHTLSTLEGSVTVDRCESCHGLWFDIGEAETLKQKWMSDHIDSGDPEVGKEHNKIRDINCPRCNEPMDKLTDPVQSHIEYEACVNHGMYLDAGEFTDYKHETLMDIFRDFIFMIKKKK